MQSQALDYKTIEVAVVHFFTGVKLVLYNHTKTGDILHTIENNSPPIGHLKHPPTLD